MQITSIQNHELDFCYPRSTNGAMVNAVINKHFSIHWFRRDLRVAGNAALRRNFQNSKGRTLGVFFFDSAFLARADFSHNRFGMFLQTLKALKEELQALGGDLLVLDRPPQKGFEFLFAKLGENRPSLISFNRDYEPFARERDARVQRYLEEQEIPVQTERDHLLIEPHELVREDSEKPFYQVYTSFFKRWASQLNEDAYLVRLSEQKQALDYLEKRRSGKAIAAVFSLKWSQLLSTEDCPDALELFIEENNKSLSIKLPEAGSLAAYETLLKFGPKIKDYKQDRDLPSKRGTSLLSIYFKNGSITPALALARLNLDGSPGDESRLQFLKEIAWREFYYHLLYHCPSIEHEAFLPQYRNIRWHNDKKLFERWKSGTTGFPIVDAGMRQLRETGWMHNRVRMIVASFLTKDLLIDYKWGEQYFMNQLLDGDLAPNNGGWQWAASTGCDAQPFFRVFNPSLQSKKFDPHGDYIRKWVPELRDADARDLHGHPADYTKPVVNHAEQRAKAISLYRNAR